MHPIERLRYVARASDGDERLLVRETAGALRGLQLDPAGLVVACRRIVERHPTSGPLWWLCASLLTASRPFEVASSLADAIETDPTPDHLTVLVPDDATVCVVGWPDLIGDALMRRGDVRVLAVDTHDEGGAFVRRLRRADIDAEVVAPASAGMAVTAADLVLVEALAAHEGEALVRPGSLAAVAVAHAAGIPVWLVVGRGRRLPDELFAAMAARVADVRVAWEAEADTVATRLVSGIVGPAAAVVGAPGAGLGPECPTAHELLRRSAM